MPAQQTFSNHSRLHQTFHFVTVPLLALCFIASIVHVWHQHTPANILLVPLSFGALMTAFIARMYALKVQDRVIRLEESLRMKSLGIAPEGLTARQFVALRFASDNEPSALAARAKAEGLTGKQIKQAIVTWRADYDRV